MPHGDPGRFDVIGQRWTAVDGSLFQTAVRVAKLAWLPKSQGGHMSSYRWHTHCEVLRGLPERIDITPANGVEIQAYLAIIACLLIVIYTGGQPNKRTYEMISFYLLGWASLDELEAHIEKLKQKAA